MDDIYIWISAQTLFVRFGPDAAGMAAKRAEQLKDQGDMEGHAVMRRIVIAITDLERTKPVDGEPIN